MKTYRLFTKTGTLNVQVHPDHAHAAELEWAGDANIIYFLEV